MDLQSTSYHRPQPRTLLGAEFSRADPLLNSSPQCRDYVDQAAARPRQAVSDGILLRQAFEHDLFLVLEWILLPWRLCSYRCDGQSNFLAARARDGCETSQTVGVMAW